MFFVYRDISKKKFKVTLQNTRLAVVYNLGNSSVFSLFRKSAEIATLLQMAENCTRCAQQ